MPHKDDNTAGSASAKLAEGDFARQFKALTGHPPFRWQTRLFEDWFAHGRIPDACAVPTGLGKTSTMALWLIARAAGADLPRRLVYVVDRRAVVDQATTFAEELSARAPDVLGLPNLPVSTLRGQHVDNRRWQENPAGLAVIVGTIDMIGSRLLFSGYGVSRRMRPYHAGLLGLDSLILLDEAHLCPPFEAMLRTLVSDKALQAKHHTTSTVLPSLRVLPLSATGRDSDESAFKLEPDDTAPSLDREAHKRVTATKHLAFRDIPEANKLADELTRAAIERDTASGPARILVYCNSRETADKVKSSLDKHYKKADCETELLVGARRVHERERLQEWLKQNGFLSGSAGAPQKPTFLVATSAGEVGVDLDAEHVVCDLVALERMVQRLGRMNRRGDHRQGARIDVLVPPLPDDDVGARLSACRRVLERLPLNRQGSYDANPAALLELKGDAATDAQLADLLRAATSTAPLYPALTRPLVDSWSLTSLKQHTGRPDIEPWLRGWTDDEPQVTVAWRRFLPWREGERAPIAEEAERYLELAPIHLEETLEAPTSLVFDRLTKRAQTQNKARALEESNTKRQEEPRPGLLLYDRQGTFQEAFSVAQFAYLGGLKGNDKRRRLQAWHGRTLLVAADLGGINENGMLDATASGELVTALDKDWPQAHRERVGYQLTTTDTVSADSHLWKRIGSISLARPEAGESETAPAIHVFVLREKGKSRPGDPAVASKSQKLDEHHAWAERAAIELARELSLPDDMAAALAAAAANHDLGKRRLLWQIAMNAPANGPYAKTAGGGDGRRLNGYRHEFGSIRDAARQGVFADLPSHIQNLGMHLIAAHHGHARPTLRHFDPEAPLTERVALSSEVMMRFAQLQRDWGPWGLAWWESLLRAADQRASRLLDEETAE